MSLRILVILALLVAVVEGESAATFPKDVQADEILSRMSDVQSIYYDGINIIGD